jgi:hypothetical protein
MATEDGIVEDAPAEPATRRRQSSHRTVVSQVTRVRVVYHHDLTLECGHVEHRVRRKPGMMFRSLKCFSCTPTAPPVVEEAKPMGWLERLIPGRRAQ